MKFYVVVYNEEGDYSLIDQEARSALEAAKKVHTPSLHGQATLTVFDKPPIVIEAKVSSEYKYTVQAQKKSK